MDIDKMIKQVREAEPEITKVKVTRKKKDGYRMFQINGDEKNHWDVIVIRHHGIPVCRLDINDEGEVVFFAKAEGVEVKIL